VSSPDLSLFDADNHYYERRVIAGRF